MGTTKMLGYNALGIEKRWEKGRAIGKRVEGLGKRGRVQNVGKGRG